MASEGHRSPKTQPLEPSRTQLTARAPTRALLCWHGGKWKLAPWVIAHFPPHTVYVEPYAGAASVLLRKPRSMAEIVNDLDGEVVNLFRVLRDPEEAERLVALIELTAFAREEYQLARAPAPEDDPVERARRLVVRSFMGHGSNAHNPARNTGFRQSSKRRGTIQSVDWMRYPAALRETVERLRGVVVESRPALEVIDQYDSAETLFYVDPPYLAETRGTFGGIYAHEMTTADHEALLARLRTVQGMVVLSGYPSTLYDDALADWVRVETGHYADGARARTEVLWCSPNAVVAPTLFGER